MTDPRDELIKVYEEHLEKLDHLLSHSVRPDRFLWQFIKTALAQGAEIKKRMEDDATN